MGIVAHGPVLIVEDSAETRSVLRMILDMRGYETVIAEDGLDALAYLRSGGRPSVVVLDVRMPNMDGMTFQRALRDDPRWASIPVVIFSAFPPQETGGALAIVPKGNTNPDVLLGAIAGACGRMTT
jgi:CheY-like chemotaxis protein